MTPARWAFVAMLSAAGLGQGAASAETFAYVGNAASNDISVFRFAPDGGMVPVQTAAFPEVQAAGSSTPLAVSPDRRFLFAGQRAQPFQAIGFAIDPASGRLSPIGNAPLADSMANIAFDRTGRFLFSASYGGNKVALNPVGEGGRLQPPSQVIPTGLNAHAFLPSPDNRFVFATNLGSDQVLGFAFDASAGRLSAMPSPVLKLPEKSGPRHFVFHPNGRFIYLLDELDAALHVIGYDAATGGWTPLSRSSAMPVGSTDKPWAADLHLTPDGRFLYASERTTSTLSAFKVDQASGALSLIGTVPTEKQPRGFAIDPSGKFLAAVGEQSHGMTVYAIDQESGALRPLAQYPTGRQPNWVEFVTFP
ncbi:beta-propeller fold lactonase family protein [Acetobacteraceae bacterium H6797]|nr:beta-propeller fold lactonase family protein [Acetobacteraceae bacterium H6797]